MLLFFRFLLGYDVIQEGRSMLFCYISWGFSLFRHDLYPFVRQEVCNVPSARSAYQINSCYIIEGYRNVFVSDKSGIIIAYHINSSKSD